METDSGPRNVLRHAEHALEDGDGGRSVARNYTLPALDAGCLSEFVTLLRSYDAVSADGMVVDKLVEEVGRPSPGGAEAATAVRRLAEILENPEALEPPKAVAASLGWAGRSTLLAAREKMGKSTYLSAAASAVSCGRPFLGSQTVAGAVLILALEEHVSDVARRLVEFDADPNRVWLLDRVGEPFADLEAAVREVEPVLTVVDTLAAFTESMSLDPGSSSDWTPVMSRLARLARDSGTALVLSHHGTKRDGSYRDSTAIGAGVDAILEMREGPESSVRQISARARWRVTNYAVRLVEGKERPRYELTKGEISLDARVIMFVEREPGSSTRAVRENVQGKSIDVSTTLSRLERDGAVENRGEEGRNAWYPVPGRNRSGTGTGSSENPHGTATEPLTGTGSVPFECSKEPHSGNRSNAGEERPLQLDLGAALEGGGS